MSDITSVSYAIKLPKMMVSQCCSSACIM